MTHPVLVALDFTQRRARRYCPDGTIDDAELCAPEDQDAGMKATIEVFRQGRLANQQGPQIDQPTPRRTA